MRTRREHEDEDRGKRKFKANEIEEDRGNLIKRISILREQQNQDSCAIHSSTIQKDGGTTSKC